MRISVIGFSGSGKTILAQKISKLCAVPHLQIDRVWFEVGGHKAVTEPEKEQARKHIHEHVMEFIAQPNWVTDGNYRRVQPFIIQAADKVIFMDIPLYRRLLNHIHRTVTGTNRHPETTTLENLLFVKTVIQRSFADRAAIEELCVMAGPKLARVKTYREAAQILNDLV